jgi:cobalt-zinc-cadmium efflux system outer membrane protein
MSLATSVSMRVSCPLLLLVGCATTDPSRVRSDVGELVAARTGTPDPIPAEQDEEARARVRERVAKLVAEPLTLERALQIAMLNNRGLRAQLEELGVAQADLVQAGLLENPVIAGDLVISTKGNGLGGGLSLSQSLLSVFLVPAKRRIAKANLRRAVVVAGDAALELSRDVKIAWAELQAAAASRDLRRTIAQVAEVADELAQRQIEAGNLSDLDRDRFAAELDEARLELVEHDLEVTAAREHLNRLLGLWGRDAQWTLASDLPEPPPADADLAALEARGVRERLDISAARAEVESVELALKLRRRGVVPHLEAGVTAQNEVGTDEGHEWVVGPSLSLELPIFDPGHADFARIRAYLRQAQHQLEARAIHARSEIREHRAELVAARRRSEYYRDTVLPRRARIVERALEQYNGMFIGAYELLATRSEQIEVEEEYIEALRDYWVARAELERAVGGRL